MNKFIIILVAVFAIACNSDKQQGKVEGALDMELPYYEESTFTPRWFTEEEEEVPENFHEIPQFQVYNQLGDTVTADVFDDKITIGNTMKLTLACDHRTIDGVTGSLFLQTLKGYLENPVTILV